MTEFTKGFGFKEAVAYANARNVVLPDEYYGKLVGVQRSQSVSIAGQSSLEQIKYIIDQVASVIDKGGTFKDFQKAVRDGGIDTNLPAYRLDNIFRTNVQAAYSRGRYGQQMKVVSTRPYWMYDAINDSRVRPTHLALDNTILRYDHPFWKTHYTPNGYRCRCTIISLTEAQAKKRGITTVPPDADPDEGWDYNVGEDYSGGIDRAIDDTAIKLKTKVPRVSKKVDQVTTGIKATAKDAAPTLDDVMDAGRKHLAKMNTNDMAEFDKQLTELLVTKIAKGEKGINTLADRKTIRAHARKHLEGQDFKLIDDGKSGFKPEEYRQKLLDALPLPARWLKKVADRYPTLTLKHSWDRAYADQDRGLLSMNYGNPSTMLHEFLHLVQVANPELQDMAREMHRARTKGAARKKLKDLTGLSAYEDSELTREDEYFAPYMGREYVTNKFGGFKTDEPLEIITMALQALIGNFGGSAEKSGGFAMRNNLIKKDKETAAFALGLLLKYA